MSPDVSRRRLAALLLFAPALVAANPSDPTVVHGSADFSAAGDVLEIRNDPGTIIDWGGFSIGADELTRFLQNSADSAVLNRVVGSDASEVLGTLASNGRVFLINPNGVVFGDGGVIDTAGFVASTLEMTDEDFLAGDLRLAGDGESGRIINAGVLTTRGGNVYFVAPDIENSGIVHAEDGSLTLAAGREVRIASLDEPGVEMIVQAPEDSVLNLGELIVERGAVRALAGTIEHSGAIEASSVSVDADGAIVLRAQGDLTLAAGSRLDASGADGGDIDVVSDSGTLIAEGSIDASGSVSDGGRVRLLGEQVGVVGDAVVDATGAGNGGEVLIGGNQEGQGPEPNASRTFIGADARVDTSSTGAEHGGRIIAFSEDETRVFGDLVARGGPEAGDGGFIETSGGSLQVMTTPDAGAAAGAPGDWLIDPDLVVIAGDATVNSEVTPATGAGGEDLFVGDPAGAADSLIGAQVIENSLEGGTSVIVRTGQTADSIIVDAPLEFAVDTPGLSLTLDANQNIIVNQLIRNTSATPIDINLAFGFGVTVGADLITGTNFDGTIAFQPVEGGSVNFVGASTLGGAVSANAVDFVMSDPTADVFIEGLASIGSLQLDAGRIEFDFVDPGPEPSVNFISGTLAMTGGTLTGVGDLQVSTLDWFGGEFAGSGSTFAFGAATIDLRGPGDDFAADPLALRDRTLRLGASSQSWNEGDIRMSGTGILDVSSDLTSNFVSPIEIVNEGGSPRVEIRPGATYTTSGLGLSVQIAFDNDGTFDFANDIDLIGGGSSTGTFALGPAATLGLGGDHQLSGPIGVGGVGSRIEQFVGTTIIDGQFPGLDQVDLPRLNVNGGTLQLAPNATTTNIVDYTTTDLTVSSGTLLIDSTELRTLETFTWTGGTLAGVDTTDFPRLQIGAASQASWSGTAAKSITGGLRYENRGETNWTEGDVTVSGDGTTIQAGGTGGGGAQLFTISNSAPVSLRNGGGSTALSVRNGGTLSHTGTGTATIGIPTAIGTGPSEIPAAQLQAFGGELHLAGGGTHYGEFEVLGDLRFSDPTGSGHSVLQVASITGSGTVRFSDASSTTTVLGNYDVTGDTVIDTGNVNFSSTFNGPETFVTTHLDLIEGTLGGTGTVLVDGVMNWEPAGTMTGSGTTEISLGGGLLNLQDSGVVANPGGRVLSGSRTLVNRDTIVWSAGDLSMDGDAVLETRFGGQLLYNGGGDAAIRVLGGTPIVRFGLGADLVVDTPGSFTIEAEMDSRADVFVDGGLLALNGGGLQDSPFDIADGATLRFGGGEHVLFDSGFDETFDTGLFAVGELRTGMAEVTAGSLLVAGSAFVGGNEIPMDKMRLTGGVLGSTALDTLPQGNAVIRRSFEWLGGDLGDGTGTGSTILESGATGTIGGTAARSIADGYSLLNRGSLTWTGGDISLGTGTLLATGADPLADVPEPIPASFTVDLSAPGTIDGDGVFTLDAVSSLPDTSTAAATFGALADLSGNVTAAGTDLHFTRGNTYSANFDLDGGVLRFSDVDGTGNTLDGSFTGTGTVAFSGPGTSTVATGATYDTGATLIDTGTVAFEVAEAATGSLTLTDGTLGGAGTLLVTDAGTWNGTGAMIGSGTTQLGEIAQLTIEGAGTRRLGEQRTLSSVASVVWNAGDLTLDGDAAIVSSGDFLIDAAGPVSMTTTGGAPLFFSSGALAKTGAGTATIGVSTALQGTGLVDGGVLAFTAPTTQAAAFTLTDPGVLRFAADASLGETGSLSGDGTLEVTAGTFELTGTRDFALGGVTVSGGTLDAADDTLSFATGLQVTGGTLSAGSVTVADGTTSTLSGGSLNTDTLDFGAGSATLDGATVMVSGAITLNTLTGAGGSLTAGSLDAGTVTLTGGDVTVAEGTGVSSTLSVQGGSLQTGTLTLAGGSTTTLSGGTTTVSGDATADGLLTLAGGGLSVGELLLGGALAGSGTVSGPVTNTGLISAGTSPGVITIDGDFVQTADGRILIELAGTTSTPGSDFDLIEITGAATLDGTLEFAALETYDPTLGDQLVPITWGSATGDFVEVIQPTTFAVYAPVIGATGLETTLVELNGNTLGGASQADVVAAEQGTTVEEIETSEEVVELGTERSRTQETCEDAKAPEDGEGEDGQQGVACRSI